MDKFTEILVSILAIIGLASVINHMMHCEEGCCLCSLFKIKKEEAKQSGEKTSHQMKENITQAGEKASQQLKENITQSSESVSQKIKEKVKQAADNVSQKMSVEKKQGTRYGSNPIRY